MANRDAKKIIRTLQDFSLNAGESGEGGVIKVDELPPLEEAKEYAVYEVEEEEIIGNYNGGLIIPVGKYYDFTEKAMNANNAILVPTIKDAKPIAGVSSGLIYCYEDDSLASFIDDEVTIFDRLEDETNTPIPGAFVHSLGKEDYKVLICKDIEYNASFSSMVHFESATVTLINDVKKTYTQPLEGMFNVIFKFDNDIRGKKLCYSGFVFDTLLLEDENLPTAKDLIDNDLISLGAYSSGIEQYQDQRLFTTKAIVTSNLKYRTPRTDIVDDDHPSRENIIAFAPDEYQFEENGSVYEGELSWDDVYSSDSLQVKNAINPTFNNAYIWNAVEPEKRKVTKHYICKDNEWIDYDDIGEGTTAFIITPANKTCYVNFSKLLDLLIAKGVDVDAEITDISELRIGLAITYRGNNGTSLGEASLRLDCGYHSGYTVLLTTFNDRWGETEYDVSGEITIRNLLSSYEGVETDYPQQYSYTVFPMLGIGTSSEADPEIYAITVEEFEEVVSWN